MYCGEHDDEGRKACARGGGIAAGPAAASPTLQNGRPVRPQTCVPHPLLNKENSRLLSYILQETSGYLDVREIKQR